MKPILFNTEMVREILDGCKTVTRRAMKPQPTEHLTCGPNWKELLTAAAAPYRPGDVLWVRETWNKNIHGYNYRASMLGSSRDRYPWKPSIHMPKEAARLFLRVKDVRVERLQDCGNAQSKDEGCTCCSQFSRLWDTTIKPVGLPFYGWTANPWVWVIEFERCEKPTEEE